MLKYTVKEFCINTGMHGYKYLFLSKRTVFEKVIWGVVVITALIGTAVTSWFAWAYTHKNSIMTITDSTNYPIWNYHFPAVTVCNFNQISKSKTYKLIKDIKKPLDMSISDLANDMRNLVQLSQSHSHVPQWNLTRLQDVLDHNNIAAETAFERVAPTCDEMLSRCLWKGEETRCEMLFEETRTSMGFCCSFNYYPFSGDLPNKSPLSPRKLSSCGSAGGLAVMLDNRPTDYFATDIASYGHRILIHNPYDFPDWNAHQILLHMKLVAYISVTPILTKPNDQVAALGANSRNCLFVAEGNLNNFQFYTYHNCLNECRIKLTIRLCGCVPFYYQHKKGAAKNRICNLRDHSCLLKYRQVVMSSIPGVIDKHQLIEDYNQGEYEKCNCLPNCIYCDYPTDYSSGAFTKTHAKQLGYLANTEFGNQSTFRVFFSDLVSSKNTKMLSYNWHNIFSLFGGLFSLLTGFSIGCAFELIYFFVVRVLTKNVEARFLKSKRIGWK